MFTESCIMRAVLGVFISGTWMMGSLGLFF